MGIYMNASTIANSPELLAKLGHLLSNPLNKVITISASGVYGFSTTKEASEHFSRNEQHVSFKTSRFLSARYYNA